MEWGLRKKGGTGGAGSERGPQELEMRGGKSGKLGRTNSGVQERMIGMGGGLHSRDGGLAASKDAISQEVGKPGQISSYC
ncbi:MAG: hypothetical protein KatS3mg111_3678 [Pirellulaceae bacterium]|nr:MAG: hypothetical protein KatS3mg111_3678 [Pirellulaceae bacterium]